MAHIVLSTTGSYGDVHPYLAVGIGLKSRGHRVTIATNEHYRKKVNDEGLIFEPIRPDFVPMTAPREIIQQSFDPKSGATFVLKKLVLPHVEESYEDLLAICKSADLLIGHPTLFAAPLVAEKLGLKWLSAVLSPAVFVSAYDPPVFPPFPWFHCLRHLGPWPHQLLVRAMKILTRSWTSSLVEIRKREGLGPSRGSPMLDDMFSPYGTMAWFSSLLAQPALDWPANSQITGFAMYDRRNSGEAFDPMLKAFLDEGEAPVVFTLGSSAIGDAGDFFEQSVEAIEELGCRAVLLVGDRAQEGTIESIVRNRRRFFVTDYAGYSDLFPRAAAVVHQGGIGTVAHAMMAGNPMLVVPSGLDQPDNAYRIQRMGSGRVLSRSQFTAKLLAKNLDLLLHSPTYRQVATSTAAAMRTEDGVGNACAVIEEALQSAVEEAVAPSRILPLGVRLRKLGIRELPSN
jgi:UDP:flavonoid glycosyltransferase YjiC (YdhE family)